MKRGARAASSGPRTCRVQWSAFVEQGAYKAAANLLDLTLYYNARFDEDWHRRSDRGNNLAQFPSGVGVYSGVSFDARGVVQLAAPIAQLEPGYPERVAGIIDFFLR